MSEYKLINIHEVQACYKLFNNKHSLSVLEKIKTAIECVGQFQPVIVNNIDGKFIAFSGRLILKAMTELNKDMVQCIVYDNLSAQEVSLLLLLNNTPREANVIEIAKTIEVFGDENLLSLSKKTPYKMSELKNYLELKNFDWSDDVKKNNNGNNQTTLF